jgi:5-dehydro-2-deoxygluconokinase
MVFQGELLILPFDHRGSLLKKLFGIEGRKPTDKEAREYADLKRMVYEGFERSLEKGVPKNKSAILVDEEFGAEILRDAQKNGILTACPIEKSGQDEFDFEYEDWELHIQKMNPTFSKVLVRLNPDGEESLNERQLERLKRINDFLKKTQRAFLFELLVPATPGQLEKTGGSKHEYDAKLRPKLMVEAIREIQDFGIEPDVWKLEGVDNEKDAKALVAQVKSKGRKAGIITLGRGEDKEKVREWLKVGARIPGIIGFAVGRTVFWDAMKGLKEGKLSRREAVEVVADNYKEFVDLWQEQKG